MKGWFYNPRAKPVAEELKAKIERKTRDFIDAELKRKHLKKEPRNKDWNYLVDIYCKWTGNRFYLCSKYNCRSPRAVSTSFESKFARLEYIGTNQFQLFFMKHTGQWIKLYENVSFKKALRALKEDPLFAP